MCPDYCTHRAIPKRQKGIGLPGTIFLILIVSAIVLAMSELNESSNLGFGQDLQSMRAFYAAESGAQVALNRVFLDGETCTGPEDANLADIDFSATAGLQQCSAVLGCTQVIVDSVTYYTFSSTATCGGGYEQAQRSIQVRARSD